MYSKKCCFPVLVPLGFGGCRRRKNLGEKILIIFIGMYVWMERCREKG
jgi:hypothetical protein